MKDCYRKALDLIARRAHFCEELRRKLEARGFDREKIDGVISRLVEERYLDDRAAAKGLVKGSLRRKGYGPLRVRMELTKRGLDEDLAAEIVREAFADGEAELARRTAERWLRGRKGATKPGSDRDALARHLARKGFGSATILSLLEQLDL